MIKRLISLIKIPGLSKTQTPLAVLVLGMHRSGTSCLTGILAEVGFHLGDVRKHTRGNPKGNQEIPRVWQLNNKLLAHNNSDWTRPVVIKEWLPEHERQRDEILSELTKATLWVLKDPRTLFTLGFWQAGLVAQPVLVGSYRHPAAVTRSLLSRDPLNETISLELWKRSNYQLLEYCSTRNVMLVCFDDEPQTYLQSIHKLLSQLGIEPPETLEFFDEQYRSNTDLETFPDGESEALYHALALAAQGDAEQAKMIVEHYRETGQLLEITPVVNAAEDQKPQTLTGKIRGFFSASQNQGY